MKSLTVNQIGMKKRKVEEIDQNIGAKKGTFGGGTWHDSKLALCRSGKAQIA